MRWGFGIAVIVGASSLAVFPAPARAQDAEIVSKTKIIELRVAGGRSYRGAILQMRPRISVRLRLPDGDELSVPWSEIVSVDGAPRETLESGTPPLLTREAAAASAPHTHWYGWQTLIADGSAVSLLFSPYTSAVALIGYVVASPVIHLVHGQVGPAVGSTLLRLTLPIAFALVGVEVENDPWLGAFGGAFLGVVGTSAIDASLLAWEPQRSSPGSERAARASPSFTFVPMLAPKREARGASAVAGLELVGAF